MHALYSQPSSTVDPIGMDEVSITTVLGSVNIIEGVTRLLHPSSSDKVATDNTGTCKRFLSFIAQNTSFSIVFFRIF